MSRHSSAYSTYPVEAMNTHTIPSMYFRPPSPYRSRASTSHPAAVKLSAASSMRDHFQASRSSASSSAYQPWEKERGAPSAPMMRRRSSSGSSSYVGGSYSHYSVPQSRPTYSPTSASTSASSRRHSRRHSVNMSARSHDPVYEDRNDRNGVSPNSIPHLREALNSLESQMASLMSERKRIESKLEQAVRSQSPVQRLPGELLGSIFVTGVYHMGEEDGLLLSTLMLVCKEWTEVALNTPILWSRITIDSHKSIPKARRKLARSKAIPLDINIQFGPQAEGTQPVTEVLVHALDLLRPAIWRWRSFRLAVPARAHAHTALSQCREPAPLLETFAVQVYQVLQDDRRTVASSGVARAMASMMPLFEGRLPRLRSSSFTSFNFGWDLSLVSNLRVLRIGGYWNGFAPGVATIMDVLRACPKLEELALRNLSDVESGLCPDFDGKSDQASSVITNNMLYPKESDMVCLKRLRRATFYYAGIERMQAVFAQLIFPALERLEFSFMENITPIIKHLKRQSFNSLPLRHLRIEACFFNELKLMRLLRHLPSLRTLELVDVEDISSNFLKDLSTPPVTQEWVCPKLDALNFDGCSTLSWDAVRTLVEARLPTDSSTRVLGAPTAAFARGNTTFVSSASAYAAQHRGSSQSLSSKVSHASSLNVGQPVRLRVLDVTRCHQINKEMVQWLRMYVAEVRCESEKTYWGEFGFSP